MNKYIHKIHDETYGIITAVFLPKFPPKDYGMVTFVYNDDVDDNDNDNATADTKMRQWWHLCGDCFITAVLKMLK